MSDKINKKVKLHPVAGEISCCKSGAVSLVTDNNEVQNAQ